MSNRSGRVSPALEWTRMTSRDKDPFFVPRPTPGYSSAYDTEKVRRNVPGILMEKSVGREVPLRSPSPLNTSDSSQVVQKQDYRYGMSADEIAARKKHEQRRKFLKERSEYVKAEGKTKRVIGVSSLGKSAGRDTPVFWQSKPTPDERDTPGGECSYLRSEGPSNGYTMSKAARFTEKEPVPESLPVMSRRAKEGRHAESIAHSSLILKTEVGTFGRTPARPEIKPDTREELQVNYEYIKGHMTRDVHLSRYAFRRPGNEDKPSNKYKQLFKQLQRPHAPLSDRLRASNGMATMMSSSRGDLPSILRHAENDRLRALSAMSMNETSPQVRDILYPSQVVDDNGL